MGYPHSQCPYFKLGRTRMDRMVGNTGGLGGFFGVLWRIGKGFPFSEGQPYQPSSGYRIFAQAPGWLGRLEGWDNNNWRDLMRVYTRFNGYLGMRSMRSPRLTHTHIYIISIHIG